MIYQNHQSSGLKTGYPRKHAAALCRPTRIRSTLRAPALGSIAFCFFIAPLTPYSSFLSGPWPQGFIPSSPRSCLGLFCTHYCGLSTPAFWRVSRRMLLIACSRSGAFHNGGSKDRKNRVILPEFEPPNFGQMGRWSHHFNWSAYHHGQTKISKLQRESERTD